jgi:metallo-beta-lactamase family protein
MDQLALQFLGAAGTVTGSRHLLKTHEGHFLIDCGLFQGLKLLRERNWEPLPIDVGKLKAVLLTHAHLDHCGFLPLLYRQGYRGPIYCSQPTRELTEIILRDSGKIQEEDAHMANKRGYSKHKPAVPLYTVRDVENVLPLMTPVNSDTAILPGTGLSVVFRKASHILGATFLEIKCNGTPIIFSGDLGRPGSPLLHPPENPSEAHYLIMESTYGDRLHPATDPADQLATIIVDTIQRKGNVLIPSFAVGRAQELMHIINELKSANRIPDVPVFMDSPMGVNATEIFRRYPDWHRLSVDQSDALFEKVRMVQRFDETREVIELSGSKIIIAASGMLTGGRALFYLENYVESSNNTILFAGYQSEGTRGRTLLSGAHEVRMHGSYYTVRADVKALSSVSGHADQAEMIKWLQQLKSPPREVFLVHGENSAREAFRLKLESVFGWNIRLPQHEEEVQLTPVA